MSSTKEPGYQRRRRKREQERQEREAANRDAQQSNDDTGTLNALVEEVRGYRGEQNATDTKQTRIEIIAAIAAVLAATLSFGSLIAFIWLTSSQLQMTVLDERPWLSPHDLPQITSDFHIEPADGPHNETISAGLLFEIENTGKTPAIDVKIIRIFFDEFASKPGSDTVVRKIKSVCDPARKLSGHGGATIFPGAKQMIRVQVNMEPGDLEAERRVQPHNLLLQPVIAGCIDYRFPWTPAVHHQTPFVYTFMRKAGVDGGGIQVGFSFPGQHISANELMLDDGIIDGDVEVIGAD